MSIVVGGPAFLFVISCVRGRDSAHKKKRDAAEAASRLMCTWRTEPLLEDRRGTARDHICRSDRCARVQEVDRAACVGTERARAGRAWRRRVRFGEVGRHRQSGNGDRGNDADDRDDNQQFDQRETLGFLGVLSG